MFHPQTGARFMAWDKRERKPQTKPLVSRRFYNKFFSHMPEEEFQFIPENGDRKRGDNYVSV